ncbi:hypothetical protein N2152v2_005706 [Parachlorella kessleri]
MQGDGLHEVWHPPHHHQHHTGGAAGMANFHEDDVLAEQLTRNVQFFGLEAQQQIAKAFVVVVGLGGVGSHAAHLLLRSGVGRLRLIDFDQVTLSSLNRHCLATRADVGTPKATCLAQHFKTILPEADVESCVEMFTPNKEEELLAGNPAFVLDAIDNIDTKVALLAACKRRGIPVLCVAGAGAKADPTRVRFVDVAESAEDPLARAVRQRLRKQHGIETGIPVLLSTERPRCGLIFGGEEGSNPLDYQIVPNFRVRTIPVLGTTPAIFGLAAAAYILCQLADAPFTPEPIFRVEVRFPGVGFPGVDSLGWDSPEPIFHVEPKAYQTLLDRLFSREEDRFGTGEGVQIDLSDATLLLRDIWRGTSARASMPPADKGLTRNVTNLTLTRWDATKPATIDNLVLLTLQEAEEHERLGSLDDLRDLDPSFCKKVDEVLRRAAELAN